MRLVVPPLDADREIFHGRGDVLRDGNPEHLKQVPLRVIGKRLAETPALCFEKALFGPPINCTLDRVL